MFKQLAKLKNYSQRTMQYVVYVNVLLIIFTYLEVKGISINPFIILIGLVVIVILIGVFDYNFIMKHELSHMNARNDIKKDLELIKKRLDIK